MNARRLSVLSVILAASIALTGCGGKGGSTSPSSSTSSTVQLMTSIPEADRPTAAEASACAAKPETWMGCLVHADPEYGRLPISGLAIPGSDNAGTYNLDSGSFDISPDSACSVYSAADKHLGTTFDRWSTTQDESITQQLDQGVRYLDLQVAYNGNGSPTLGWRVTQNVFSDFPLYDYLDQVAQWAHQHPTEVVIIGIRRICYDGNPTTAIDDGLWSNFSTPSTIGGGGTTIADVAFDAASLGKNSFATATIDDIVQQQGGGHTVVVLAPSTAVARGVLARKYDVHAAFTTSPGSSTTSGTELGVEAERVHTAPLTSSQFVSASTDLQGLPLTRSPALGSLVSRGLTVSWLGYTLYGTTLSAQSQLFARFAGLVEPTVVKRGKAVVTLQAWQSDLFTGHDGRDAIATAWGHKANIVVSDGVEFGGFIPAVIELNSQ